MHLRYLYPLAICLSLNFACVARAEEETLSRRDKIVDTFIDADIGKLKGEERRKAFADFRTLNSDLAIPAVVRGVNIAADIRSSCPIMVLARKLQELVGQSSDAELLSRAVANLKEPGAKTHYGSYLQSLKGFIENRLRVLEGRTGELRLKGGGTSGQLQRSLKPLDKWTVQDLQDGCKVERGANLVGVLEEMKKRKGGEYTRAMLQAIGSVPDKEKELARGLLVQRLTRLSDKQLVTYLQTPKPNQKSYPELRSAAIRAIDYKESKIYRPLIAALLDPDPRVRTDAHSVLVKMTGEDFGPTKDAPLSEAFVAQKKWLAWESQQKP